MEHLLQPRPLIDNFEQVIVNAYASIRTVEAIWVREIQALRPSSKSYTRSIWLQLRKRAPGDIQQIQRVTDELGIRTIRERFGIEVHWMVDDLPPKEVAPSCIFRRGSGRV